LIHHRQLIDSHHFGKPWQMSVNGMKLLGVTTKSFGDFWISFASLSASLGFFTKTAKGFPGRSKLPFKGTEVLLAKVKLSVGGIDLSVEIEGSIEFG
jgi:hypothetical protein